MEFRVLGPVEVSSANGPIQLGPPKQRALLAALLARANQVVSLDRLIDDLWGSEPPPAATGSLQAYIANLRRVLEPERSPRTPAQILRSLAPGYQLRVGPGQLDAGTFETGLREGRSRLADGAPGEALAALRAALQLWRGPAFADVAHWDFLAPEVARLAELRLVGQESYAEAALALNRAAEMVPYLQRLVTEAPLREHLRELLVLALYRSGRQADALQVIAEARRLFIAELGITPGPALASLQSAILAHDPRLDAPPALAHPNRTATGIRAPSGADDHAQRSPFVGREQPLQVARNVLDAASSGHGSLLMLMGEPGIGKTRLAEEVAALAAGRGFGLGWGRCPDNEGVPAFWPWIQIMRDLTGVLGPHRFDAAVNHTGPHLTPLLPTPDGSPADATPSSRFLACDAAVRLLKRLAREQPLLLVLDDVHWADAPTAELAGYLAGQLTSVPIVVILTFRDSEVSDEGRSPR